LLLGVLIVLSAILACDHWPEHKPDPPVDYAALTVEELIVEPTLDSWKELFKRGWSVGPEVVEGALSHEDAGVRVGLLSVFGFIAIEDVARLADASVVTRWRDQIVRMLVEDKDPGVRWHAMYILAFLIREEFIAEVPSALWTTLRAMMAEESDDRFSACLVIFWLGERAISLRDEVLAMDLTPSDRTKHPRQFVCWALGSLGVLDAKSKRFFLDTLENTDAGTRASAASALGQLRASETQLVGRLITLLEDSGEESEVRQAALSALAQMPLAPDVSERVLQIALRSRELFASYEQPMWVECVAGFAVQVEDPGVRESVIEALAVAGRGKDLRYQEAAVAGAVASIAVVADDEHLIALVMPTLLHEIRQIQTEPDRANWMVFESTYRLAFEGLVDICLWRDDTILVEAVTAALHVVEANQNSWVRKWSRGLRARLRQ